MVDTTVAAAADGCCAEVQPKERENREEEEEEEIEEIKKNETFHQFRAKVTLLLELVYLIYFQRLRHNHMETFKTKDRKKK